ncbi:E3 ubiquitin-protein ligase MBR1-like [Cornus florida]|uniref:E3 ubiquitin-protein ligase MBR1-like n=1 Tax=Cornus florida TaxID=4283 RepID=UPI0028A172C6|nr:E3 ubiquitin-protein ligase MBR1-like [Cornus florida]
MGGRSGRLDRFRDWRLDVDNMTYEQLVELGDRIGYVNTGLREHEILSWLRKTKMRIMKYRLPPPTTMTETERKCSICQEEYEEDDKMGKLDCGHLYHIECIKRWLKNKNICPICKTQAVPK